MSITEELGHQSLIEGTTRLFEIESAIKRFEQWVNPGWARLLRLMGLDNIEVEGKGVIVRDGSGKEYIDCLGGYGVFNLGHRHPEVLEAVKKQLDAMPLSSRMFFASPWSELAELLAQISPGELRYSFLCHSGTEAVEGSLKLARMASGKPGIIAARGAFHGKSMGSLSASGRDLFKKPVEPLVPGFVHVPYGDAGAIEQAITDEVGAVILEPIQGEAGVIVPPPGYLRDVREICDRHNLLLILDEVQTGFGRTGKMFAAEHEGVAPDIMSMSKALGGGVMPLGAFMGTAEAWAPLEENPFIHTTSIVNLAACAGACASIRVLLRDRLADRAAVLGERFMKGLREIQKDHPDVIKEVRGKGLLIGMSFVQEGQAAMVMGDMFDNGVLVGFTWNNPQVLRLEPPLIITEEQVDRVLDIMGSAVKHSSEMSRYN